MEERRAHSRLRLEPGTGRALELRRGMILRIEQIEGGQCVDFNCFNLHDYKEFFHTGRTRHMHGLHPTKGDFLWSAPPRERPMMYILEDTAKPTMSSTPAAVRSCTNITTTFECTPTATTSRRRRSANTA
jgi:uncharacterized protein YcgI (DUF1989 family)